MAAGGRAAPSPTLPPTSAAANADGSAGSALAAADEGDKTHEPSCGITQVRQWVGPGHHRGELWQKENTRSAVGVPAAHVCGGLSESCWHHPTPQACVVSPADCWRGAWLCRRAAETSGKKHPAERWWRHDGGGTWWREPSPNHSLPPPPLRLSPSPLLAPPPLPPMGWCSAWLPQASGATELLMRGGGAGEKLVRVRKPCAGALPYAHAPSPPAPHSSTTQQHGKQQSSSEQRCAGLTAAAAVRRPPLNAPSYSPVPHRTFEKVRMLAPFVKYNAHRPPPPFPL